LKIKEGVEVSTSEFWYDMSEGYLSPQEILEDKNDIEKVYRAINTLKVFKQSCEEQIEGFIQ
jgi:hypothetical protein